MCGNLFNVLSGSWMEETLSSSAPDKGEIIIAADYPDQEADFFFLLPGRIDQLPVQMIN